MGLDRVEIAHQPYLVAADPHGLDGTERLAMPHSFHAPSIWKADVATPHTKPGRNALVIMPATLAGPRTGPGP